MPNWLTLLRKRLGRTFSPRLRGTLSLSVPIFCTLTIFTAWMSTRLVAAQARKWVDHTEDVISSADRVHFRVLRLESSSRRHVITGNPKDPIRYQQNQQDVLNLASLVHDKVADNIAQQTQWQRVQTLLDRRLEYFSRLLTLQQQAPESDSQILRTLAEGEAVMQSLSQELEKFQDQERSLLADRERELDTVLGVSMIAGWGLLFGSLMSSLVAVYLFRGLDTAHADQSVELRHSQQTVNAIADSVVDGVVTVDQNDKVIQLNRSAKEMFGYDDVMIYPFPLAQLIDIDPSTDLSPGEFADKANRLFEAEGVRHGSETFPVEGSVSELSMNQQRFVIVRDISERRETRRSLEKYATELEYLNEILSLSNQTLTQRNEELDQFAYLASHDLKAPLRAITNLSTWIEDDVESELSIESRELFQLLRGRANRLEKLIDALAYYVQLGQQPLELRYVDVGAIVSSIIARYPESKNFTFELPDHFPVIQAHTKYLTSVLQHLIENAMRFHPTHAGTIEIEIQELETAWQFSVIDDGDGIEPQYHERIFGIFQTLQARDKFETTGIGLAIVTKILQIVGGQISVTSSPGEGACFQFLWPK